MAQPRRLDTCHYYLKFHVGRRGSMEGLQETNSHLKLYTKFFLDVHMCFFQEEGSLLIRDLVCKSEFLFGCFLEML